MSKPATIAPTAELAERIARAIAQCDIRVTLSRVMYIEDNPWIVTIGNRHRRRHMVIESVTPDASDANLVILSPTESQHSGSDINWRIADWRTTLKKLTSGRSYESVMAALRPG